MKRVWRGASSATLSVPLGFNLWVAVATCFNCAMFFFARSRLSFADVLSCA